MDLICASICYRGYADDEVAATLEFAPKIGYESMEIHGPVLWSLEAVEAFDLPAMRARVEASGMKCVGLHTLGWGGADDEDVRVRARAIARVVGFAEELGCHHVTTTGASRRDEAGALNRVMDCVRQVLDRTSDDSPVKLTLEPHYGNVLEQRADFDFLMEELPDPRIGLCVDTGHFHSAGVDTLSLIRDHAARIYALHLKDHLGTVSVGIGRGEVGLPAILATLQDVGYEGGLTLELEVEDPENLPRYTEEAYLYLSGMLGRKL
jgi:sugar phosphate isomerase/epimerase